MLHKTLHHWILYKCKKYKLFHVWHFFAECSVTFIQTGAYSGRSFLLLCSNFILWLVRNLFTKSYCWYIWVVWVISLWGCETFLFLCFDVKICTFLLGEYLVELLGHRVCILSLVNTASFWKWLYQFYIPSTSVWDFHCFASLPVLDIVSLKKLSLWWECHSISWWSNLQLPDN